ncbi:hypothetical protein M9H77_08974 [Catharanthus roseus]|uniref:Uncharacterized protein n=1 Tax=Catharanthus roseus TaxID=4058 RepID=A0ACC0BZI4_CATRO|nr:hypothetical protein M9H77_08974 [Catharanthus roseus]
MHKRSLENNIQRSKRSLKITRFYEDEVIKMEVKKVEEFNEFDLRKMTFNFQSMNILSCAFDTNEYNRKGFNKRGKKPPFKKGGQSSLLFKARCFGCNSTDHFVVDCPKAIEKEKRALEAKLEAIKKKKKGKGLIGAWDQDSSESEEKRKQTCASWHWKVSSIDDDDDPNSMLIEIYDEFKKISKRNKDLKNKIDDLLNENSKLVCENKTLLEFLEVLKNENDFSNKEIQELVLENKNLCEKVLSLEKCMVDYNNLKKKVNDLTMCIEKFTKGKENFEKLLGSQRSPIDKNGIGYKHSNTLSN